MDIAYNKTDGVVLPITNTRISASEYNQIAASLMQIITSAGLTPDVNDNGQLLAALKGIVGFTLVETYTSGTSWYKVWEERNPETGILIGKWCEQGGRVQTPSHQYGQTTVDLLKTMADKNYSITLGGRNPTMNGNYCFSVGGAVETTYFVIFDERSTGSNHTNDCYWVVKGYMA